MNWPFIFGFLAGAGVIGLILITIAQQVCHELRHDIDCWQKRAGDAESQLFWLKAQRVDRELKDGRYVYFTAARDRDSNVSIHMVDDYLVTQRKAIAEKASPDANNTF
jgi:hypothetical protein